MRYGAHPLSRAQWKVVYVVVFGLIAVTVLLGSVGVAAIILTLAMVALFAAFLLSGVRGMNERQFFTGAAPALALLIASFFAPLPVSAVLGALGVCWWFVAWIQSYLRSRRARAAVRTDV